MADDDLFSWDESDHSSSPGDGSIGGGRASFEGTMKDTLRRNSGAGQVEIPYITQVIGYAWHTGSHSRVRSYNALDRSLYDTINEMNEGQIDSRAIHFMIEAELVTLHSQLRLANQVYQALDTVGRESNSDTARMGLYTDMWADLLKYALDVAVKQYRDNGAEYGYKIYDDIIERGAYPYLTPSLDAMTGAPGDFHWRYGNVAGLRDHAAYAFEFWITHALRFVAATQNNNMKALFAGS